MLKPKKWTPEEIDLFVYKYRRGLQLSIEHAVRRYREYLETSFNTRKEGGEKSE